MARMPVATAVLASLFLANTPAHADDAEVCILRSVETRTPPRKPNVIANRLDCGPTPTDAQVYLAALVNNADTTVEALQAVVAEGYEVEAASWRDSFSGRQELGIFTLVLEDGEEAEEPTEEPAPDALMDESTAEEDDAEGAAPSPEAEEEDEGGMEDIEPDPNAPEPVED